MSNRSADKTASQQRLCTSGRPAAAGDHWLFGFAAAGDLSCRPAGFPIGITFRASGVRVAATFAFEEIPGSLPTSRGLRLAKAASVPPRSGITARLLPRSPLASMSRQLWPAGIALAEGRQLEIHPKVLFGLRGFHFATSSKGSSFVAHVLDSPIME